MKKYLSLSNNEKAGEEYEGLSKISNINAQKKKVHVFSKLLN